MSEVLIRKLTVGNYSLAVGKSRQSVNVGDKVIEVFVDSIIRVKEGNTLYYKIIGRVAGGEETFLWKEFVYGAIVEYDVNSYFV